MLDRPWEDSEAFVPDMVTDHRLFPAPTAVSGNPAQSLRNEHVARGLSLDAQTTRPGWLGERLDVGYVIDVLYPRLRWRPGD